MRCSTIDRSHHRVHHSWIERNDRYLIHFSSLFRHVLVGIKFRTNTFIILNDEYEFLVSNPCKDVTFGGCNLQGSDKVLSKKQVQTVQLCNEECYNTDNCTNYRYISETKECTLTKKDYRFSECNIRAGPMVRSFGSILFYHCNEAYLKYRHFWNLQV